MGDAATSQVGTPRGGVDLVTVMPVQKRTPLGEKVLEGSCNLLPKKETGSSSRRSRTPARNGPKRPQPSETPSKSRSSREERDLNDAPSQAQRGHIIENYHLTRVHLGLGRLRELELRKGPAMALWGTAHTSLGNTTEDLVHSNPLCGRGLAMGTGEGTSSVDLSRP